MPSGLCVPVRLGDVRPARRRRLIATGFDAPQEVAKIDLQLRLVVLRCHSVDAGDAILARQPVGLLHPFHVDQVVQQIDRRPRLPLRQFGYPLPFRRQVGGVRRPSHVSSQRLSPRGVSLPSGGFRPSPVSRVPRYYEGATTSHSVSASAYVFRSRSPRLTSSFVSAFRALPPIGGLRRAWSSGQPGDPFPVLRLRGRFGTSQVRSAILPAPLPSSQDPGRTDETSPLAVPSAPPPRTGKRRLRQGRIFRG